MEVAAVFLFAPSGCGYITSWDSAVAGTRSLTAHPLPCSRALGLLRADSETTGLFVACQTCGLQELTVISVHPCHVLEAGCVRNKCAEFVDLGCVLLAGMVNLAMGHSALLRGFFVPFLSIVPFL